MASGKPGAVQSLTPPLAWLWEAQETAGNNPKVGYWHDGSPHGAEWPTSLHRAVALRYFREWAAIAKPHRANTYTGSDQRFWSEITKVIPLDLTRSKDANGDRCVTISLDDLRVRFQAYMRGEPNE